MAWILAALLVVPIAPTPAPAAQPWAVACPSVDGRERCLLAQQHDASTMIIIGHSDDDQGLTLMAAGAAWRHGQPFAATVDGRPLDLSAAQWSRREDAVLATIRDPKAGALIIGALRDGIGLDLGNGSVITTSLDGFDAAWRRFAARSPVPWVRNSTGG